MIGPRLAKAWQLLPAFSIIESIIGLGGFAGLPPHDYNPSNRFQQQGDRTQYNDQNYVGRFPFICRL
jgi:hypothetical protein